MMRHTPIIVAVAFAAGFTMGGQVLIAPADASPSRERMTFVHLGSALPALPGVDESYVEDMFSREKGKRALAALLGEERLGLRRIFAGHDTLTVPYDNSRRTLTVDVFWELGRRGEEVGFSTATRRLWFKALSGVIHGMALDAARRDDGEVGEDEWLQGFMVPVRIRGYGVLLARFCWHTHSGQTGESFSKPTPALELFKPNNAKRAMRFIETYEAIMR